MPTKFQAHQTILWQLFRTDKIERQRDKNQNSNSFCVSTVCKPSQTFQQLKNDNEFSSKSLMFYSMPAKTLVHVQNLFTHTSGGNKISNIQFSLRFS